MHVLLDVHAASNDQQNVVAFGIASSHEDRHEVTNILHVLIRTRRASLQYCVTQNRSTFGIPINNHG